VPGQKKDRKLSGKEENRSLAIRKGKKLLFLSFAKGVVSPGSLRRGGKGNPPRRHRNIPSLVQGRAEFPYNLNRAGKRKEQQQTVIGRKKKRIKKK